MVAIYTLLMQKTATSSAVKSSFDDFGFAANDIPWPDEETVEPASRVWPGEDGEDVYISPNGQKLKAYDLVVEFCYKGQVSTAYAKYKAFRDYLIGVGGFLKIYDPYWGRGRQNVYVKKCGDLEPFRTNIDEGLCFKVTFCATDPKTEITLMYVGD